MLYRQIALVLDGAEEQFASIVSQTKNNPLVYLSVQDILDAFTSQLCDVRPPLIKKGILIVVWRIWVVCILVQYASQTSLQTMHGQTGIPMCSHKSPRSPLSSQKGRLRTRPHNKRFLTPYQQF